MDRTRQRRVALWKALKADRVDALLVSSESNVRYLTGFTGEDAALLLARDRAVIVSDGRFEAQLQEECPGIAARIRPPGRSSVSAIAEAAESLGIRRLGFDPASLSVADHEALRDALPALEWAGLPGRVEALRVIKDAGEIAAIREAIGFAERAFAMLRAGLRGVDSEKATADALEGYLRHCGASGSSFPPIVAVGARAARPHARPTADIRIDSADFVLIDWGASGSPYKSDLTRVLVTGKVTTKFEKVYQTVLAAQARGIAAIRPGAMARDVDAEARSVIEEAGFGRFFNHGLGHGLGLDIHEAPAIRQGSETRLLAGMVVTVEPGIYLPGWGGIRIEDDVLVTPDGSEVLTDVPKALHTVRIA